MQEVHTTLDLVEHTARLSNCPGIDGKSITIINEVDITKENNKVLIIYCYTVHPYNQFCLFDESEIMASTRALKRQTLGNAAKTNTHLI